MRRLVQSVCLAVLTLAFVRPEEPDSHLEFSWWTSLRELPPGTKNPLVTLHLLQGAQEIAATRSPVVPTQTDWQFLYQEFVLPATPVGWMTLADLTKRDGEIRRAAFAPRV